MTVRAAPFTAHLPRGSRILLSRVFDVALVAAILTAFT